MLRWNRAKTDMQLRKTYCKARLLCWAALEFLMYALYTAVTVLRPPCTRTSHDGLSMFLNFIILHDDAGHGGASR